MALPLIHWYQLLPEADDAPQLDHYSSMLEELDKAKKTVDYWEERADEAAKILVDKAKRLWTPGEIVEAKRQFRLKEIAARKDD